MRPRDAALLFLAGAAFFLPALATRDVWQSLESRYTAAAREMALDGHWFVPRFNGEIYTDKPPLLLWGGAILFKLGCGLSCMRVLGALAAAGTLVATAALGALFLPRRTAFLGAAILATIAGFAWDGRFGELDIPLAFLTTTAVYGWFAGGRKVALFYACTGLALLAKGPQGLVVALLAVAAGRVAGVRPSSPRAPLHPAWGTLIAAALPGLWLAAAITSEGMGYGRALLGRHVVERLSDPWIHARPPWYYVTQGVPWLLPWLVVAIPAVVLAWRRRRDEPWPMMLVLWFACGFLLFSALRGKRVPYLLPFAPALALLAARGIDAAAPFLRAAHAGAVAAGAVLLAFGLGGGEAILEALRVAPHLAEALVPATRVPGGLAVAAGGAAVLALGLFGLARVRDPVRSAHTLVATVVLAAALADATLSPRLDTVRSSRAIAARTDALGGPKVALHPDDFLGLMHLYSERRRYEVLRTPDEVRRFLADAGAVVTREMSFETGGERIGRLGAREVFLLLPAR